MRELQTRLSARPAWQRWTLLVLLAAVALTVPVAAQAIAPGPLVPLLGGLGGAGLVALGLLARVTVLSPKMQEATDLRAGLPLARRRRLLLACGAGWALLLLVTSRFTHGPVAAAIGTLNVAVVVALVALYRRTDIEIVEGQIAGDLPLPAATPSTDATR